MYHVSTTWFMYPMYPFSIPFSTCLQLISPASWAGGLCAAALASCSAPSPRPLPRPPPRPPARAASQGPTWTSSRGSWGPWWWSGSRWPIGGEHRDPLSTNHSAPEDGDDEGAVPHVAAALGVRHGPHDPRGGPDRQEGEDQARHQHPHLNTFSTLSLKVSRCFKVIFTIFGKDANFLAFSHIKITAKFGWHLHSETLSYVNWF